MESMERSIEVLEEAIQALHHEAMVVADRYWLFVNQHAKQSTGLDARSNLELACGKKGNHLEIKWQSIAWYGPKDKRARIRKTIAKDVINLTYPDKGLREHAKDWEWPMVKLTEMQMRSIRRQAHHLVRAIMAIRSAKSVRKISEPKIVEQEKMMFED